MVDIVASLFGHVATADLWSLALALFAWLCLFGACTFLVFYLFPPGGGGQT